MSKSYGSKPVVAASTTTFMGVLRQHRRIPKHIPFTNPDPPDVTNAAIAPIVGDSISCFR